MPSALLVGLLAGALLSLGPPHSRGQSQPPPRAAAFTVLLPSGRQVLTTTAINSQEFVALDDLVRIFQLTAKEDALAGGLTLTSGTGTLVLSTSQGLASLGGRVVSVAAAPVRQGRGWLVPIDTVGRAFPLLLQTPVSVRRESRLVLVGDVKVPRITARADAQGDRERVVIDIDPPTRHATTQDGTRLVVRFQAEALDVTPAPVTPGPLLQSIHLDESGTAVVLDLGPAFASFQASDQPGERGATRLTIDLAPGGGPPASTPAQGPPAAGGAAPGTPATVEPPLLFEPPTTALRTIVLDPGHGGDETGAKGPGGALEKDVALAVARQLKGLLESRLGVRVLLTRDGDQTVALDARAALANNNKADVFVSLHANASVRGSARGAEVFYLSAGEYNGEARQHAALEAELMPAYNGGERRVEMILWEMAQLQHLQDSAALASIVEQQLRARVPMTPAAIQQAPFIVLVGANMPAVLVEMGFVTNPDEEKLLTSPAHQALLAQAIFDSLVQFRDYVQGGRRLPDSR
jgi:N-acetylmuramoyl-L-alanine amidase